MTREHPITYEELPAEHKQKYDKIKALFKANLIGPLEKMWTCPPLQKIVLELCARK
jgi:hypothetical protein